MYSNRMDKSFVFVKLFLLATAVSVVLQMFSLTALASYDGESKVSVSAARFCTDEIASDHAYIKNNPDGTVTLLPTGKEPRVSMLVSPLAAETEANALRVVLRNDSRCDSIFLEYVYKNSAHLSENGTVSVNIKREKESEEYIIPLRWVDKLTKLDLTFNGGDGAGNPACRRKRCQLF